MLRRSPHGVVGNMVDCDIVVKEFKSQLQYWIHFLTNILRKGMKPLFPSQVLFNSITAVLLQEWL